MRQEDKTGDDPTLADIAERMDGLAKRMDAGCAKVDGQFEKIDAKFESLRLELKGDIKHLDSKIDKLMGLIVVVCVAVAGLARAGVIGA